LKIINFKLILDNNYLEMFSKKFNVSVLMLSIYRMQLKIEKKLSRKNFMSDGSLEFITNYSIQSDQYGT